MNIIELKPFKGAIRKKMSLSEYVNLYFERNMPATYDVNGNLQCKMRRRRSFSDLFSLCKAKFNDVTVEQLATELVQLLREKKIKALFCPNINKVVFFSVNSRLYGAIFGLTLNGYGCNGDTSYRSVTNKGIDDISFQDILDWGNSNLKEITLW